MEASAGTKQAQSIPLLANDNLPDAARIATLVAAKGGEPNKGSGGRCDSARRFVGRVVYHIGACLILLGLILVYFIVAAVLDQTGIVTQLVYFYGYYGATVLQAWLAQDFVRLVDLSDQRALLFVAAVMASTKLILPALVALWQSTVARTIVNRKLAPDKLQFPWNWIASCVVTVAFLVVGMAMLVSSAVLTLLLLLLYSRKAYLTIKRVRNVWGMDNSSEWMEGFLIKIVLPLRSMVAPAAVLALRVSYEYGNFAWTNRLELERILAEMFDVGVLLAGLIALAVQCYSYALSREQRGDRELLVSLPNTHPTQ